MKVPKCDLCLDAAQDEGASGFEEEALDLIGEDIADHLCEEIETQGEVECSCPCKPAEKKRLRERIPEPMTRADYLSD